MGKIWIIVIKYVLPIFLSIMWIVGIIDLRHHIDHPILSTWGGHIGYYVRPSERRKGYATKQIALALDYCKSLDIDKVLMSCTIDNIGSEKKVGYKLN